MLGDSAVMTTPSPPLLIHCYNDGNDNFKRESRMERQQYFDTSAFQKSLLAGFSQDEQALRGEDGLAPKQEHSEPHPLTLPVPSLSIDNNNPSLALLGRNSIEQGLPIPRAMLSHSQDLDRGGENGGDESGGELYFNHKIKVEVSQQDKEWFVEQLGLNELLYLKKFPSNTKNVLRNFGNAQNQYALYHRDAKEYVHSHLATPQRFYAWIRLMRLEKFDDFKAVWNDERNRVFKRVYRQLCYRFYRECAIPYVLVSRMKSTETKLSHLRYIYRFLQGLKEPDQFNYFKKVER